MMPHTVIVTSALLSGFPSVQMSHANMPQPNAGRGLINRKTLQPQSSESEESRA